MLLSANLLALYGRHHATVGTLPPDFSIFSSKLPTKVAKKSSFFIKQRLFIRKEIIRKIFLHPSAHCGLWRRNGLGVFLCLRILVHPHAHVHWRTRLFATSACPNKGTTIEWHQTLHPPEGRQFDPSRMSFMTPIIALLYFFYVFQPFTPWLE